MNWNIAAGDYQIWNDFSIQVPSDLSFKTHYAYHLTGVNGSGKSSFLRKVLIPQLMHSPEDQYIVYIEQQIQSQFDAVKANAALHKPLVRIDSFEDMINYLIKCVSIQMNKQSRPCLIISDESALIEQIQANLTKYDIVEYCLVFVSHQDCIIKRELPVIELNFRSTSPTSSTLVCL